MADSPFMDIRPDANVGMIQSGFAGLDQGLEKHREEEKKKEPVSDNEQAFIDHIVQVYNTGEEGKQLAQYLYRHPKAAEAMASGADPQEVAAHIHIGEAQKNGTLPAVVQGQGQGLAAQPAAGQQGAQSYLQASNGLATPTAPDSAAAASVASPVSNGLKLGRLNRGEYEHMLPVLSGLAKSSETDMNRLYLQRMLEEGRNGRQQNKIDAAADLQTEKEGGKNTRQERALEVKKGEGEANRRNARDIAGGRNRTAVDVANIRAATAQQIERMRAAAKRGAGGKSDPRSMEKVLQQQIAKLSSNPTILGNPIAQEQLKIFKEELAKEQGKAGSAGMSTDQALKELGL